MSAGRLERLPASARRPPVAAALVALALLAIYGASLAPDVTFWDAGEFIAAGETLGVPHPPGTPLYVLVLAAWSQVLSWLPTALATNLVSAVCTAAACGVGALLLAPRSGSVLPAVAGALCAGTMSTVWLNATETEVYATTLALAVVTLAAAERAGRTGERRWLMLVVYLTALAVPLHMSALVAGPAIVYAAGTDAAGRFRWSHALIAGGAWLVAMGVGTVSVAPAIAGLAAAVAGAVLEAERVRGPSGRAVATRSGSTTAGFVLVAAVATTALLYLIVRAQYDPAINQGAPTTLEALGDVIARRQYDVAPLWPRRAPLWLQLGNVFLYADWQVALSLGPTVMPTPLRTGATIVFAALGVVGSLAHRQHDVRSWRILLLLLASGSLGVVVYLNLRAGPSFGWGILPDDAIREARERDYFFVLGFWAWGLWAGYGAVVAVRRYRLPAVTGLAVAGMPIALNWASVNRRYWPEAELPRLAATSLLEAAPARSVLFVGGDNDTYPLWYAQTVLGVRRDVTVVTTPLLPADWYRAELWRRHRLHPAPEASGWHGRTEASREIARRARALGRPVAAAISMAGDERRTIASRWQLRGPVFVELGGTNGGQPAGPPVLEIDSAFTGRWASAFEAWRRGRSAPPAIDPTAQAVLDVLSCPGWVVGRRPPEGPLAPGGRSLASLCNLR